MSVQPEKLLALQFKYFGDAVLMTPALRALREHFPNGELHLLVPEEIAPLFQFSPHPHRVWAMPRRRGRASLNRTLPLILALRREHFDRSVDFASNDRGAILSRLIGAGRRLGWDERGGFLGRRFCYTEQAASESKSQHESARLMNLLSAWQIPPPPSLEPEIHADPALAGSAQMFLPYERSVICHVASSQPKKEWPLAHWAKLHQMAVESGFWMVFTTGLGQREQTLMMDLKKLVPQATILPAITELPLFLAVLARSAVFVSGDTGPLHFASGLGVPTISLFGPSSPVQWAPIGPKHRVLTGKICSCDGHWDACRNVSHCLAAISPEQVFDSLQFTLKESKLP